MVEIRSRLPALARELKRRRVFRVVAAYAAAGLVVLEAADLLLPALPLPAWAYRVLVAALALGLPLVVALSWMFDLTPAGIEKTPLLDSEPGPSEPVGDGRGPGAREEKAVPVPAPPTRLIGRVAELERARRLLVENRARLITFTGPGGSGKTRLAIELSRVLEPEFEHGAVFVALAPVRSPDLVVPTIVQSIGFTFSGDRPPLETLKAYLRHKSLLLILDNFEHVLDAAPAVAGLLEAAPDLTVLVTSRTALELRGEFRISVPPLPVPPPGTEVGVDELADYESIALFLERAQAVDPGLRLSDANAEAIVEICRRLDGLPLALELAAARVRLLTPQALRERLHHSLGVLSSGPRDLPDRQRTLRDTIRWSYDLLEESERALLRAAAIFVGGFGIEAAEAVFGARGPGQMTVLDGLESLVSNSLVKYGEGVSGLPRFTLLETIREFGLEAVADAGEEHALRARHARHYLALAEEAAPHVEREDQFLWLERLEEENGNLRSALAWLDARGDEEVVLRMAGALWRFWWVHAHVSEARGWLERAESAAGVSVPVRALALVGAANLAAFQAELGRGRDLAREALRLFRTSGDPRGTAITLGTLGKIELLAGELDRAAALLDEGLALARGNDQRWVAARAMNDLGEIARVRGDLEEAWKWYEESLETGRSLGTQQTASTLYNLGAIELLRGDYGRAGEYLSEGLALAWRLGDKRGIANGIEYLVGVWAARGEHRRATRILGRADALREEINVPLESVDQDPYDRAVGLARDGLSDQEFEAARREGRSLALDEAYADALVSE